MSSVFGMTAEQVQSELELFIESMSVFTQFDLTLAGNDSDRYFEKKETDFAFLGWMLSVSFNMILAMDDDGIDERVISKLMH